MTDQRKGYYLIPTSGTATFTFVPNPTSGIGWTSTSGTAYSLEYPSSPEPTEEFWTPEPVMGYRAWVHSGKGPLLSGLYGVPWPTSTMVAVHPDPGLGGNYHQSPSWACLCGVNAMKSFAELMGHSVTGLVSLTGIIHEYERGYRAERAEILEMYYVPSYDLPQTGFLRHLHQIYLNYRVPIYEIGTETTKVDSLKNHHPLIKSTLFGTERSRQHGHGQTPPQDHL